MQNLDLGLIGNCSISALIDREARIVWCCLPRFDGDPIFHALLGQPKSAPDDGIFSIEIENQSSTVQTYIPNTAVLKTTLRGETGSVEITDFCPRFYTRHRAFRPQMLIRQIVPIEGNPRVKIRLRPRFDYGAKAPTVTYGSNHIRYVGDKLTVRLTTDAPIDYLLEETAFKVTEPIHLVLGPDETLPEGPAEVAETFLKNTINYWRTWTHRLAVPVEWQEAVIRAAITLKMCAYEPTGAIVAAMTTSIPEAPNSARNWDYRYCWVRDAFFVVRALNSLAAVRTLENYFRWIMNIVDDVNAGHIQPVFGIALERKLTERTIDHLPGYRGMGPVRVGNQAHEHFQHDTYGNLILAAAPAFFDTRLFMTARRGRIRQARSDRRARLPALRQARRRHLGAALARAHPHLVEPDVLGRLRPAGEDRGPPRPDRAGAVLGRTRGDDPRSDPHPRMVREAPGVRRKLRRRDHGRQRAADERSRLHRTRRPPLYRHGRAHPGGIRNRPPPDAL